MKTPAILRAIARNPSTDVFFLALSSVVFIVILNASGTAAGYFGVSQARSASIRLREVYILNVQSPILPAPDNGAAPNFQIEGWTTYLYLNGACTGPTNGAATDAREGLIGARCQKAHVAERYFISTKPNLTGDSILDPQIICYKGRPNHTDTYYLDGFGYDLPCDLDENAAWPRYLVSLAAPFALHVIGLVGVVLTIFLRMRWIRNRIPRPHMTDIIVSAVSTFFFLITAILLTSDAVDVRDWVNGQNAPLVYDARLGTAFFVLLWLIVGLTLISMVILIMVDHIHNHKSSPGVEMDEPPGYETVTRDVRIQS